MEEYLQLRFGDGAWQGLRQLMKDSNSQDRIEVVQKALKVFEDLVYKKKDGFQIILRKKGSEEVYDL